MAQPGIDAAEELMQLIGGDQLVSSILATAVDPDAPLVLDVDVSMLMQENPALAAVLCDSAGALAQGLRALLQRRLDTAAALDTASLDCPPCTPPSTAPWLSLRLCSVPLPAVPPFEAAHVAAAQGTPTLASVFGVVTGASAPYQRVLCRRVTCLFCGSACDVAEGARSMPCCGGDASKAEEDVTARIIGCFRHLWLSDLRGGSAGPNSNYGISCQPLLAVVPWSEGSTGPAPLGEAVSVVGFVSAGSVAGNSAGTNAFAAARLEACGGPASLAAPQRLWRVPGPRANAALASAAAAARGPLAALLSLFDPAMGVQVDPHLSLALLASAAAAASGAAERAASDAAAAAASGGGAGGGSVGNAGGQSSGLRRQVNVLVVHEEGAPQSLRTLHAAAELLSPQVSCLPLGQAEQVSPIFEQARAAAAAGAGAPAAVYASALAAANCGVAVVNAPALAPAVRKRLSELLPLNAITPRGAPPELAVPLTTTVWGACGLSDVAPGDPSAPPPQQQGAGGRRKAGGLFSASGFDLVLEDGTEEAQLLWGPTGAVGQHLGETPAADPDQAAALLRHAISLAAVAPGPSLGADAHAFLSRYAGVLRQSTPLPLGTSQPGILDTLARVARAVAALCGRNEAVGSPDAMAAVLLVDQTIVTRMGGSYVSALDLPGPTTLTTDPHTARGRCIDEQLSAMHALTLALFDQFAPPTGDGGGSSEGGGGSGFWGAQGGAKEGDDGSMWGGGEEGDMGGVALDAHVLVDEAAAGGWGLALSGDESDAGGAGE